MAKKVCADCHWWRVRRGVALCFVDRGIQPRPGDAPACEKFEPEKSASCGKCRWWLVNPRHSEEGQCRQRSPAEIENGGGRGVAQALGMEA